MGSKKQDEILWTHLKPEELHYVRQSGNYYDLAAGRALFQKGELADGIYVLVSGELDILDVGPEGKRVHLTTLTPGAVLGEIGALTRWPRTASAVAKTGCIVFQVNEKFIQGLINYRPGAATQFLINVLTIMANTIVRLTDDISRLKTSK